MPSALSAALERLAKESEAISAATCANNLPSGPFTTAFLDPSVLTLVRDADESERQPFRRLLDDRYTSLTAGPSTAAPPAYRPTARERKEPETLMTPLRQLPRLQNTPQELDATLSVLEEVISSLNETFSLKRARNEVRSLAHAHAAQRGRIAELRELIEDARRPRQAEPVPEPEEVPELSIDEALAAEEDALRALEASLVPLRREQALRNARSPTSPKFPSSSVRLATPTRTPKPFVALPPAPLPVVTNSLVQSSSATPLRPAQTPRLRTSQGPRSIFGPPRKTMTPSRLGPLAAFSTPGRTPRAPRFEPALAESTGSASQSTPPRPRESSPSPVRSPTPTPAPAAPPARALTPPPPQPAEPAEPAARLVEGVEIDHAAIPGAINQIWTCVEPLMRTAPSASLAHTPEATLAHLASLSRRDPDASITPAITTDTVLLSHTMLMLLRGVRTGRELAATGVPLSEIKADLAAVARARAWDAPEDLASKIIYRAVGLKIATIVRREDGKLIKPKVRFVFPGL